MTDDPHLTSLRVLAAEIIDLLGLIRVEISQPARRVMESFAKIRVSHSPSPWNDEAGELTVVIEAGARDHEQVLARILYNGHVQRGAGSAASIGALTHLPDLIMGVREKHVERAAWRYAEKDLSSWARSCRVLLDQAKAGDEEPSKAPGDLRCPHCAARLLLPAGWVHQTSPVVYCPTCRDENNRRLSWPADTWIGALQEDIA